MQASVTLDERQPVTRTTFDVGEAAARGARPFLVVCAFSLGAIAALHLQKLRIGPLRRRTLGIV